MDNSHRHRQVAPGLQVTPIGGQEGVSMDINQAFQSILDRIANRYRSMGLRSNQPRALVRAQDLLKMTVALNNVCTEWEKHRSAEVLAEMSILMLLVLGLEFNGSDS